MPKYLIALFIIIIFIALYFGLSGKNIEITNYPPKEGPIVAFGDSLVYGTGSISEKGFLGPLSEMIGEPIENLGYPGDTTEDGLQRLQQVIDKNPRIVILLLGGNDYLKRLPIEKTFTNLEKIIDQLLGEKIVVVLLGIRGGLLLDHFDEEFEILAKKKAVAFVPNVLNDLLGKQEFMADQIHPNDTGYTVIANKIYPVLSKVLR